MTNSVRLVRWARESLWPVLRKTCVSNVAILSSNDPPAWIVQQQLHLSGLHPGQNKPFSFVSGSLSASLNSPANGCTALGWKTSSQLPTRASAQSTSGRTASGTTMASSFSERMPCPPYSPKDRIPQRCGITLIWHFFFSKEVILLSFMWTDMSANSTDWAA